MIKGKQLPHQLKYVNSSKVTNWPYVPVGWDSNTSENILVTRGHLRWIRKQLFSLGGCRHQPHYSSRPGCFLHGEQTAAVSWNAETEPSSESPHWLQSMHLTVIFPLWTRGKKISVPCPESFQKKILPALNVFFSCSTDVLSHKFRSICTSQGELVSSFYYRQFAGNGSDIKKIQHSLLRVWPSFPTPP